MRYFQKFRIDAGASKITYDEGLKSTESEPKRLIACHIQMDTWSASDDNDVQGWHERAKVFDIPERMFNYVDIATTPPMTRFELMTKVPVDIDIPVGETFKVAMSCGTGPVKLRGMYEYEIIS